MPSEKKVKKVLHAQRKDASSLSSFVERPLPTDKEVASFERVVKKEARHQEIEDNLSEIYRDKKGALMNVKTLKAKRKTFFLVRWFRNLLVIFLLGAAAYFAYFYFFARNTDVTALELKVVAPDKVIAGEEFSYIIEYHNPTQFNLTQLRLEMQYPANFIFKSASISPQSGNYGWNLPELAAGGNGEVTITGQLISLPDSANIVSARLNYVPQNYTSQYKKEMSASTIISGPGFQVDLTGSNTAFLNQDNDLTLIFSDVKTNYLEDFNISFSLPAEANAWVATTSAATSTDLESKRITVSKTGGTTWQVSGLVPEIGRQEVPLKYKVKVPSADMSIVVRLEKKTEDGQSFVFWEKTLRPEMVKSDLNLTLFLNGAKTDGAVNFSQTLNYTLSFSNKGSNTFKDVVVMASLNGDFLDWKSLRNEKGGELRNNNTLIWTKNEISELEQVKPGDEGEINFSINLKPFAEGDLGKNLNVVSYAQYSVDNKTVSGDENKSNTITSRINSDLSLNEQIRYFDDNNTPVGSGPLPPKVGEKSSFRVYWVVKNNLHELTDAKVVLNLPPYVNWDEKASTNVGNLNYDASNRQVVWEIGRLPVSVYRADAQFNISLTPAESDRDTILVLSPGSIVTATDTETKETITKKIEAKTTKLEDDDIAGLNNSGKVQ